MDTNKAADSGKRGRGVLVIYTGGTIGMVHQDSSNPLSPLVPGAWEELEAEFPQLKNFEFPVEGYQWKRPIDSSNIVPQDWIDIAQVIQDNYKKYQGFVILHGTDTMAYTTAALSFLLESLTKPVIVTGSQLPIAELRSDAAQNLITSIMMAAPESTSIPLIPEVCLFFRDKLYRGNRVRKISSSGYSGFDSPNYSILGEAGEKIEINEKVINRVKTGLTEDDFYVHRSLDPNVASLEIFPGIQPNILKAIFDIEELKGVVLKTYGAGNTPTYPQFLEAIGYGVDKGKIIIDVTQCNRGMVEIGLYEASAGLLDKGVVSGLDMTPEAALTKMGVLLGQGYNANDVRNLMQINQRGEQSMSIYNVEFKDGKAELVFKYPPTKVSGDVDREKINLANVRVQGVTLLESKEGEISLSLFLNLPSANEKTSENVPQFIGSRSQKWKKGDKLSLIFDATTATKRVFDPGRPVIISVISRKDSPVVWERLTFFIYESV